jgi:HEPN domain-containing protein
MDKNRHEAERWLQTAEEDLRAAQLLRGSNMFAHACFLAQQSGEKSLKAMWYLLDQDPWGHSIQRLAREFPEPGFISDTQDWLQRAAILDRFYIPTRYPNGLPDLTPGQSYFLPDANQAIKEATFFLEKARDLLASH